MYEQEEFVECPQSSGVGASTTKIVVDSVYMSGNEILDVSENIQVEKLMPWGYEYGIVTANFTEQYSGSWSQEKRTSYNIYVWDSYGPTPNNITVTLKNENGFQKGSRLYKVVYLVLMHQYGKVIGHQ